MQTRLSCHYFHRDNPHPHATSNQKHTPAYSHCTPAHTTTPRATRTTWSVLRGLYLLAESKKQHHIPYSTPTLPPTQNASSFSKLTPRSRNIHHHATPRHATPSHQLTCSWTKT